MERRNATAHERVFADATQCRRDVDRRQGFAILKRCVANLYDAVRKLDRLETLDVIKRAGADFNDAVRDDVLFVGSGSRVKDERSTVGAEKDAVDGAEKPILLRNLDLRYWTAIKCVVSQSFERRRNENGRELGASPKRFGFFKK